MRQFGRWKGQETRIRLGNRAEPNAAALQLLESETLSSLMIHFAENGLFSRAQSIWDELINSSCVPSVESVSELIRVYAAKRRFDDILTIIREFDSRGDADSSGETHSVAVSCFGEVGELEMMERVLKEMSLRGFRVDSLTGNAFVKYYSMFGSLTEMETACERLKKSRILVEAGAIRAMALAYIRERKFYRLGEFLRDVGLKRRNVGNLLWNLLLLSYAVNFKMKSLQREFLHMVEAGFSPDLTTFNVRALAFSKMCMFWDLHLSLEHMKHVGVVPDLVTCGCVVDAYLERRLGRNLSFGLEGLDLGRHPVILTDPIVFEAFGKGDFHLCSEAFLEPGRWRMSSWTYSKLIEVYLKRTYRSNQIFWNY
ncbi:Pentatricopeptide repeat-containing protein [Acorus gramineus]|uniref:Pentatricopeptide repeat-containing protein n=1 Tax=Acorus gramineus TaxID=55184 RepID=A0AAV9BKA2_ACOGR|nr:Pentatricopeptide repeat-containing protein [Acorus gramineus]